MACLVNPLGAMGGGGGKYVGIAAQADSFIFSSGYHTLYTATQDCFMHLTLILPQSGNQAEIQVTRNSSYTTIRAFQSSGTSNNVYCFTLSSISGNVSTLLDWTGSSRGGTSTPYTTLAFRATLALLSNDVVGVNPPTVSGSATMSTFYNVYKFE